MKLDLLAEPSALQWEEAWSWYTVKWRLGCIQHHLSMYLTTWQLLGQLPGAIKHSCFCCQWQCWSHGLWSYPQPTCSIKPLRSCTVVFSGKERWVDVAWEDRLPDINKGTLVTLWNKQLLDATIPRAIHFVNDYQDLLVFSLETGEMWVKEAEVCDLTDLVMARSCWDAQMSHMKWSKVLKSGMWVHQYERFWPTNATATEAMPQSAHRRNMSSLIT